jgi:hypothetical protein
LTSEDRRTIVEACFEVKGRWEKNKKAEMLALDGVRTTLEGWNTCGG